MSTTELRVPAQTALTAAPAPRAVVDYDFPSVLAAPPKQRLVLWLMAAIIAFAAVALAVARVNIIIAANGVIKTSGKIIVIQPIDTSIVRSVAVKQGDTVRAGEVLATLDPTFSEADVAELSAKLRYLQAASDRLGAELAGQAYEPVAPTPEEATQREIFRKRQQEYLAKLTAAQSKVAQYRAAVAAHKVEAQDLAQQITLVGEQETMYRTLVAQSLASKLKLLDASQRLAEARLRLDGAIGEQRQLVEQIGAAVAERDAFIDEWRRKLSEEMARTRNDRDAAAAQLSKAQLRHELSVMRAPADATVLEVANRPDGSVIRAAETLMRLVPAGVPTIAEVQVDTRDVARLHVGDPVTLKFEALPWQQFGLAHGVLRSLSPDVLADDNAAETAENMTSPGLKTQARQSVIHYRASVAVTETKFRNLPSGFRLRSGMRLVANIKVGRRSVLGYILNPITRVIDDSLHEP